MQSARFPAMLALLSAFALSAQQPPERPSFEAASVKLNNSGSGGSSSNGSKGQLMVTNMSLRRLVEQAYSVSSPQVSGPDWMNDVHVDIAAKYPSDTKREDRPLMLRTLLEDRFKLTVHHTSGDLPGYSLVVAKGGFKLKPVDKEGGPGTSSNSNNLIRTLKVTAAPMPQLAATLTRNLQEMVVDRTGIEGVYTFELRWAEQDQKLDSATVDSAPTLFTALQETLGLQLKPGKVPTDIIVVDHLEKVPVEN